MNASSVSASFTGGVGKKSVQAVGLKTSLAKNRVIVQECCKRRKGYLELTIGALPETTQWLRSSFYVPNPWLNVLISLNYSIIVCNDSFSMASLEVKLEEINCVQQPKQIDVLQDLADEDGLRIAGCICLTLRDIEVRNFAIAYIRVKGQRREDQLNYVEQATFDFFSDQLLGTSPAVEGTFCL